MDLFSAIIQTASGGPEVRDYAALSYNYIPKEIEFRDDQITKIVNGIKPVTQKGYARNLALVGPAGTGKTLTIRYALKRFKEDFAIKSVYFPTELSTTYQFLTTIAETLGCPLPKGKITNSEVHVAITNYLIEHNEKIILVFDEVDTYFAERQNDLFMPLLKRNEGMVSIVLVTNRIYKVVNAFTEAFQSVAGLTKVDYPNYTIDELGTILEKRAQLALKGNVLDEGVIRYIAAVVANENGDARYGLHTLSAAVDIASSTGQPRITMDIAKEAFVQAETEYLLVPLTKLLPVEQHVYLTIVESLEGKESIPRGAVLTAFNAKQRAEHHREYSASWMNDKVKHLEVGGFLSVVPVGRSRGKGVDWVVSLPNINREATKAKLCELLGVEK